MALTLAQYEARVSALLMDTANTIWPTATLDECLRLALHEYSDASPLQFETVITLPGDSREIALAADRSRNGLRRLVALRFRATTETWPPNRVRGWRLYWDDLQPVLYLETEDDAQPQLNDELRLWYSKIRTIQNLDSASITTVQAEHESWLVLGAAGHAAFARATDLAETVGVSAVSTPNLAALGSRWLKEFRRDLDSLAGRRGGALGAPPLGRVGVWTGGICRVL